MGGKQTVVKMSQIKGERNELVCGSSYMIK